MATSSVRIISGNGKKGPPQPPKSSPVWMYLIALCVVGAGGYFGRQYYQRDKRIGKAADAKDVEHTLGTASHLVFLTFNSGASLRIGLASKNGSPEANGLIAHLSKSCYVSSTAGAIVSTSCPTYIQLDKRVEDALRTCPPQNSYKQHGLHVRDVAGVHILGSEAAGVKLIPGDPVGALGEVFEVLWSEEACSPTAPKSAPTTLRAEAAYDLD